MKEVRDSKRIERILRCPANEFPANPMPGIDAGFMQGDRIPSSSQCDSQRKSGQAATNNGDYSFHAIRRNEPRQSTDSSIFQPLSPSSSGSSPRTSRVNAGGQIVPGQAQIGRITRLENAEIATATARKNTNIAAGHFADPGQRFVREVVQYHNSEKPIPIAAAKPVKEITLSPRDRLWQSTRPRGQIQARQR
jgi:hypothetical protein